MELNFGMLVAAALAGLIVNAILGFNPWAILGTFSLLVMLLPLLGLMFNTDPQAAQVAATSVLDRLVNALPSVVVGDVAGSVAGATFKAGNELFRQ